MPDFNSPPRGSRLDPEHPPVAPATISNPNTLRVALQGRTLETPVGWYSLQESWTKLTVKALRDLGSPEKGLHEAILDVFL